jgi:hypothetical protein
MANKRIKDLPMSNPLIGTEAFIVDQRNSEFLTGFNTVQLAMSGLSNYILIGQPYINITGDALINETLSASNIEVINDLDVNGLVNGRDVAADGTLLDDLDSTAVRNISGVEFIQRLTQAQYNSLTPDSDTLYVIVG